MGATHFYFCFINLPIVPDYPLICQLFARQLLWQGGAFPFLRNSCFAHSRAAEILGNGYQGRIPLPRIPTYRGTKIAAPKTVETPDRQSIAALAMHMLNGDTYTYQRTRMETHANRISEPIIFVGS